MHYFQDIGCLLIYCLFSVLYVSVEPLFVAGLLCALILSCIGYFSEQSRPLSGAAFLFFIAAVIFPPFFCFFPAAVYVLLCKCQYCPVLFAGLLLFLRALHPWNALLVFPSGIPAPSGAAYGAAGYILFLFGAFGFLLAALLWVRSRQYNQISLKYRQTQDDSRERNLLLSEKNKSILEKQDYEIYTATLKERNRIAREIHDNVGHVLSRSILLLGAAKAVNQEPQLVPLLDNLDSSLNSAMDSIRSSVHDLHDESVNLKEAVRNLISGFTFCPASLQYDMNLTVPKAVKYCFISITKEALSNIIRHSNAGAVQITMREHPALFQLCIEDNGTQYPPNIDGSDFLSEGIGLSNMRDRVNALHGTFLVTAGPGFRIFVTIPKEEERSQSL